jgi:hypothetical protein
MERGTGGEVIQNTDLLSPLLRVTDAFSVAIFPKFAFISIPSPLGGEGSFIIETNAFALNMLYFFCTYKVP